MNSIDEIIELYKRDVDVTMIDEGLKRTVDERMQILDGAPEHLRILADGEVEFIVVGGVAAVAHGSARFTLAVDLVYRRNRENVDRLVKALSGHKPRLRGAPNGFAFQFDRTHIEAGLNFRLATNLGWIDLLGELCGCGKYEDLLPLSDLTDLYGTQCRVANLDTLIRTKIALLRPKDFEAIAELELLRDRSPSPTPPASKS